MKTAAQSLFVLPLMITGILGLVVGIILLACAALIAITGFLPFDPSWWGISALVTGGGLALTIIGAMINSAVENAERNRHSYSASSPTSSSFSQDVDRHPDSIYSSATPSTERPPLVPDGPREPGLFAPENNREFPAGDFRKEYKGSWAHKERAAQEESDYVHHRTDKRPSTWGW